MSRAAAHGLRALAGAGSLALLLALSACGFHLAGERPLPPALTAVYINLIDPYRVAEPPLESALQKRIEQRGGAVKSKVEEAKSVLRLSDLHERQEVLAVGSDGKAIEYRLITTVRYELDVDGRTLVTPDVLTVSRDYSFSAQQILAKDVEQSRLRDYIQGEMADLLLLRLEAVLNRKPELVKPLPSDSAVQAPTSP